MNFIKAIAFCASTVFAFPAVVISETYRESFECSFGKGIANRPTPERVVFSIDGLGRSALLQEVDIPKIDTKFSTGEVKRDSPKVLVIGWGAQNYVYTASGRTYATNESRYDAIDLLNLTFTLNLNRNTMKAIVKSTSTSSYLPRDGFAKGKCKAIVVPAS